MRRLTNLLLLTGLLAGCADSWPVAGRGGWAERDRTSQLADNPAVHQAHQRLTRLGDAGAERYFPGRLADARLTLTRAHRESTSGFDQDAAATLGRLETLLADLETRLAQR